MKNIHLVPGFELMTFSLRASSFNHLRLPPEMRIFLIWVMIDNILVDKAIRRYRFLPFYCKRKSKELLCQTFVSKYQMTCFAAWKCSNIVSFSWRRWITRLPQRLSMYGFLPCMCCIIFGVAINTTAYNLDWYVLLLESSVVIPLS